MTREICEEFALEGKYRAAVRILRYHVKDEDPPCRMHHVPGRGSPKYYCNYEGYSINLPLRPENGNDNIILKCKDLPTNKLELLCFFGGVWLQNCNTDNEHGWSYPFRWYDVEILEHRIKRSTLFNENFHFSLLSEAKLTLGGKKIVFCGSSLIRETFRAFNELLYGSAIPCFFEFGTRAVQSCIIQAQNGELIQTFYISHLRPWYDEYVKLAVLCSSKKRTISKHKRDCEVFNIMFTADIFITSPEGLYGSQISRDKQKEMIEKTALGIRTVFGLESQRKAKVYILETTIAGEGGITTVFQNVDRMLAFNELVRDMAIRERFEIVRIFEASRVIIGSSYDNVHMCPQCCNTPIPNNHTVSRWNNEQRAIGEMMGCHMKVDVLLQSLLKPGGP